MDYTHNSAIGKLDLLPVTAIIAMVLAASLDAGDKNPSPVKIERQPAFYVIGLAARTTNANEMTGHGQIGKLWEQFGNQNLSARIPNKEGDDIVALYTGYQSDQNGEYTYLLGRKVTSLEHVPSGLVGKKVPAGRYAIFLSETGPPMDVVPRLWQHIWALSPPQTGGLRSFLADYELYDGSATDPAHSQVRIYIGIR